MHNLQSRFSSSYQFNNVGCFVFEEFGNEFRDTMSAVPQRDFHWRKWCPGVANEFLSHNWGYEKPISIKRKVTFVVIIK